MTTESDFENIRSITNIGTNVDYTKPNIVSPKIDSSKLSSDLKQDDLKDTSKFNNKGSPSAVTYASNFLDDYTLVTYHFRLYIPSNIREYKNPNVGMIIAESGRSTFSIDDVAITVAASVNSVDGTSTGTEIRFSISEPYGCTLVDKIHRATIALGIENHLKCPYILELWFNGYDKSGALVEKINGWSERWPIMITAVDATVSLTGTLYDFVCYGVADTGEHSEFSDTQQTFNLGGSTVGEVLQNFSISLSDQEKLKVSKSSNQLYADEYVITAESDYLGLTLSGDEFNRSLRNSDTIDPSLDLKKYMFGEKVAISKIIECIMASTEYFQKVIKDTTSAAGNEGNPVDKVYKELFRIETDVDILEYDVLRKDYRRRFTFKVVKHKMANIYARTDEKTALKGDERTQRLKTDKVLRKKYEYIFTGKNDQIIDFDLKLNFSWYAAMPSISGEKADLAQHNEGVTVKTPSEKTKSESKNLQNANTNKFAASTQPSGDTTTGMIMLEDAQNQTKVLEQQRSNESINQMISVREQPVQSVALSPLEKAAQKLPQQSVSSLVTMESDAVQELDDRALISKAYSASIANKLNSEEYKRVQNTDIANKKQAEMSSKAGLLETIDINKLDDVLPLSWFVQPSETRGTGGNLHAPHSGRAYFDAMFSQAVSPKLSIIKLTLRGDPEWMRFGIDDIGNLQKGFELIVITPKEVSINSGLVDDFSNVPALSGVYLVTKSISYFKGGMFTQDIHAAKDVMSYATTKTDQSTTSTSDT